MKKITIDLDSRSYPVHIQPGLLEEIGEQVAHVSNSKKMTVISDNTVAGMYGDRLLESFKDSGIQISMIQISPGEASKRLDTIVHVCRECLNTGLDRTSGIIAFGGGVVGDIAGFVAAIYLRGIPFIQIPTTLLASCDSSVGGKVGINFQGVKNLLGSFYQPDAVFIDPELLKTLPKRELVSGFAEAVKTGLIGDSMLYRMAIDNVHSVLSLTDTEIVSSIIHRCVLKKADVVSNDEKESGLRRILNFGHTIGHGIEAAAKGSLLHGEAVLYGMSAALWLSMNKGILPQDEFNTIINDLIELRIPFDLDSLSFPAVHQFIKKDKKIVDNRIRFILLESVGKPVETDTVTEHEMAEAFSFIQTLYHN